MLQMCTYCVIRLQGKCEGSNTNQCIDKDKERENREYKFRVLNELPNGELELIPFNFEDIDIIKRIIVDDVIINQYSGLKDEEGNPIYDGDIVVYHDVPESDYESDCYLSGEVIFKGGKYFVIGEELEDELIELHDNVKVIGNIYQNKELLDFSMCNDLCRQKEWW